MKSTDPAIASGSKYASGVYALYKDGYVIAAVVVGKDASSVENTFYALGGVNMEEYTDGQYYWSVKGIMNGVETTVRERGDWGDLTELKNVKAGDLLTLGLDSEGFVVEANAATTTSIKSAAGDDIVKEGLNKTTLTMEGWTLYLDQSKTNGIVVADECPTALVETIDGETEVTYYSSAEAAIKAMQNRGKSVTGSLIATLDSKKMATSVIIVDSTAQGFVPPAGTDYTGDMKSITVSNKSDGTGLDVKMTIDLGETVAMDVNYTVVATNILTGENTTRQFSEHFASVSAATPATINGSITGITMNALFTYKVTAVATFSDSAGNTYAITGIYTNV